MEAAGSVPSTDGKFVDSRTTASSDFIHSLTFPLAPLTCTSRSASLAVTVTG
jgi:hypothetical protein